MDRFFKIALPLVLLVDIALALSGVLDPGTALVVGLTLELVALAFAARQVVAMVLHYRRSRSAGLDVEAAIEDGLTVIFPRPVARVIALEPRVFVNLWRRLFDRRPLAAHEFAYHKRSPVGALFGLILFTTPVELFLFELLIPWTWLRVLLAVLAVYGLLWIAGYASSLRTLPHRVGEESLRLHYGLLGRVTIPYEAIESVELAPIKMLGNRTEGVYVLKDKQVGYFAVGGKADVLIRLREPVRIERLTTDSPPVRQIYAAVDDPAGFARLVRERLAGPQPEPPSVQQGAAPATALTRLA
jgi:hypothetical protein